MRNGSLLVRLVGDVCDSPEVDRRLIFGGETFLRCGDGGGDAIVMISGFFLGLAGSFGDTRVFWGVSRVLLGSRGFLQDLNCSE